MFFYRRSKSFRVDQPIVSFTFDDFPRSALQVAGRILEQNGVAGTYYTSFGLMGTTAPTGQIFGRDDLPDLFRGPHEVACHTFHHLAAWETRTEDYIASVERNAMAYRQLTAAAAHFTNHSFPISFPRIRSKRWLSTRFQSSRAGGQTYHRSTIDFNHLSSFFIEQSVHRPEAIKAAIEANAKDNGWLIFSTHDVCDQPTRYGCTPRLFEDILAWSKSSGARILTVAKALEAVTENAPPPNSTKTSHVHSANTQVKQT